MTVRQLLHSIDAEELAEWVEFFRLERELSDERTGKKPKQVTPAELDAKARLAVTGSGKVREWRLPARS